MLPLYMPKSRAARLTFTSLALILALNACKKIESEQGEGAEENELVAILDADDGAGAEQSTQSVTVIKNKDGTVSVSSTSGASSSVSGASAAKGSASAASTSSDGENVSIAFSGDGINLDVDVPVKQWTSDAQSNGSEGLYPGTQVTGVNVNTETINGKASGQVRLNFTSPAAPDTVADYMMKNIRKKGGKATRTGDNISAKDADGDNYTITLKAAGSDKTQGVMVIGKSG